MNGKVGDRIQILGQNVGSPSREGEILQVMEGTVSVRYRIRWQDGHESVLSPGGGSAVILPSSRKASKPKPAGSATKAQSAKTRAKTQKAKTPAKATKTPGGAKKKAGR